MAQMATPWKHPNSGHYYLRRQIPEALRPAFGGKAIYKASLRTKNFAKAAQLFVEANAALEREFEVARERLEATGDPRPSQKDHRDHLLAVYFAGGAPEGGLDGPERLTLAFLEGDRLINRVMRAVDGAYGPPSDKDRWASLARNSALFQSEMRGLKGSAGQRPGKLWKMAARSGDFNEVRVFHAKRVIHQICGQEGLSAAEVPAGMVTAVIQFLDQRRWSTNYARASRGTPHLACSLNCGWANFSTNGSCSESRAKNALMSIANRCVTLSNTLVTSRSRKSRKTIS